MAHKKNSTPIWLQIFCVIGFTVLLLGYASLYAQCGKLTTGWAASVTQCGLILVAPIVGIYLLEGLCFMFDDEAVQNIFTRTPDEKFPMDEDTYKRVKATATQVAIVAHMGQVDKGGSPYIEHPLAVSRMVQGRRAKIVAILHDVLEDSSYTPELLISLGIPKDIVTAVIAITRNKGESWDDYLARVKQNPVATQVKIADLRHNSDLSRIKKPTEQDEKRRDKYLMAIHYLMEESENA